MYFHCIIGLSLLFIYLFCFLKFIYFQGCTYGLCKFLGQRSNQSCSCRPMPQPQQHRILAVPVTYRTAHGNTRCLTHEPGCGSSPHPLGYQWDHNPLSHDRNSYWIAFNTIFSTACCQYVKIQSIYLWIQFVFTGVAGGVFKNSVGFCIYTVMSVVNNDSFTSSFPIFMTFELLQLEPLVHHGIELMR